MRSSGEEPPDVGFMANRVDTFDEAFALVPVFEEVMAQIGRRDSAGGMIDWDVGKQS